MESTSHDAASSAANSPPEAGLTLSWEEVTDDLRKEQPRWKSGMTLVSPNLFKHVGDIQGSSINLNSSATSQENFLWRTRLPPGVYPEESTPPNTPPATSTAARTASSSIIQDDMAAQARKRHVGKFYTIKCNDEFDLSTRQMDLQAEWEALTTSIQLLRSGKEKDIVEGIIKLGQSIRLQSKDADGMCGTMISRETIPVSNSQMSGRMPQDVEQHKPDIVVQKSDISIGDSERYDWTHFTSFVEVKRDGTEDCKDQIVLQSLRYVRKMVQYHPITSHSHFITWCGHLVRLWYADAIQFGCSRAFNTRKSADRHEITKILRLLMSAGPAQTLRGDWDPIMNPPRSVDSSEALWADGSLASIYVRPGPFGSRTAVWAGQPKEGVGVKSPSVRRLLKCSWRPRYLVSHELAMIQHVASTSWILAPRPIGLVAVPDTVLSTGFSERTSLTCAHDAPEEKGLHLSAMIFDHYLGHQISPHIHESSLLNVHFQLTKLLLVFAEAGLHYRDLNEGNVRLLDGTEDQLLLVDFGNMRKNLSPRGKTSSGDFEAVFQRAEDDVRSANALFLPTCYDSVTNGIENWYLSQKSFSSKALKMGKRAVFAIEKEALHELRNILCDVVIHSHRYIDDLESVQYLHVWQPFDGLHLSPKAAGRSAGTVNLKDLEQLLHDQRLKKKRWEQPRYWELLLDEFCPSMTQKWIDSMLDLQSTIHLAQKELRARLSALFETTVTVDDLYENLQAIAAQSPEISVEDALSAVFFHKGRMESTEQLLDLEKRCFSHCIQILEDAVKAS